MSMRQFDTSRNSLTGQQVDQLILAETDRFKREKMIESWVDDGNIPDFLSDFYPLNITSKEGKILTLFVSREYLCFGDDSKHTLTPMFPTTAQSICDKLNCVMPTPKIVDMIWKSATIKLTPEPWGPPYDASMMSSMRIVEHNRRIEVQRSKTRYTVSDLIAGHKKDVVIANGISKHRDKVFIYGWHQSNGNVIQPLSDPHENHYADYSHSVRLVSKSSLLDGSPINTIDVYQDSKLSKLVSNEGPLTSVAYFT